MSPPPGGNGTSGGNGHGNGHGMGKPPTERIDRERLLNLYTGALLRGDLDALIYLRRQAEGDPELQKEIDAIEAADRDEIPEIKEAQVRYGGKSPVSPLPVAADRPQPRPLTVGDVATRMLREGLVAAADRDAAEALRGHRGPLPPRLGPREVRLLSLTLGVAAPDRFWQTFREVAVRMQKENNPQ